MTNQVHTTQAHTIRRSFTGLTAALGVSAAALLAMLAIQIDRALNVRSEPAPPPAMMLLPASMDEVTHVGEYTAMTFNAGSDDVLAVLDGRGEQLFVYRIKNQKEIEFVSRDDLKNIFATARRLGPGRP